MHEDTPPPPPPPPPLGAPRFGAFYFPSEVVFSESHVFSVPALCLFKVGVSVERHTFAPATAGDRMASFIDEAVLHAGARTLYDTNTTVRAAVDGAAAAAISAAAAVIEAAIRGAVSYAAAESTNTVRLAIDEAVDHGLLMHQLANEMNNNICEEKEAEMDDTLN